MFLQASFTVSVYLYKLFDSEEPMLGEGEVVKCPGIWLCVLKLTFAVDILLWEATTATSSVQRWI